MVRLSTRTRTPSQGAVHRIMDVGFDYRAVDTQFPTAGDLQVAGALGDVVEQAVHRRRLDEVSPAPQRGIVGHPFGIHATELAQDQAVADPLFRLLIAPIVEVLDDEHAQDDLHGC
jgi:hypothetical protein